MYFPKIKIPWLLSQATVSNHPNTFTSTLPLSEGRTGEAWEPSNRLKLFLPQSTVRSFFFHDYYTSSPSGFEELIITQLNLFTIYVSCTFSQ
jgi:hypothetical protein